MSTATDRERELILVDEHLGSLGLVIELDRVDLGRLHGVHDVDLLRIVPAHDVDLLAVQLVDNVLDPRAANSDAGADAVNLAVDALDRDLGAVARVAGQLLDLNDPLGDLGDLELEQVAQEVGVCAAEHDSNPLADLANLENEALDSLARVVSLSVGLLAEGDDPLAPAEANDHVRAVVALHGARNQRSDPADVLVVGDVALGFPDLLNHDLLRGQGSDPTQVLEVGQRLLVVERRDFTRRAADLDHDVALHAELLLGGREERRFDSREDDLLVDPVLAVHLVY